MKLNEKIQNNKTVILGYKLWFYFIVGKDQIGKITSPFNEIGALVVILTMVLGIDLTQHKAGFAMFIFFGLIGITTLGYIFKKVGLWDTEQIIFAVKNPVQKELYSAAKKINKSKKV